MSFTSSLGASFETASTGLSDFRGSIHGWRHLLWVHPSINRRTPVSESVCGRVRKPSHRQNCCVGVHLACACDGCAFKWAVATNDPLMRHRLGRFQRLHKHDVHPSSFYQGAVAIRPGMLPNTPEVGVIGNCMFVSNDCRTDGGRPNWSRSDRCQR